MGRARLHTPSASLLGCLFCPVQDDRATVGLSLLYSWLGGHHHQAPPGLAVGWSRSPKPLLPHQIQRSCFSSLETRTSVLASDSLSTFPAPSFTCLPSQFPVTPRSLATWSSADTTICSVLYVSAQARAQPTFSGKGQIIF